ncbi:MAG: ComF family protein [Methylobacillus sp.]|nr:ComF family protein [Methylobacillus sp.]
MIDASSKISQILFPPACALCGADARKHLICQACEDDLPWHDGLQCPVCAIPTGTGEICGHCLLSPPAFDATRALLAYQFPVSAVLQCYKYAGFLAVAHMMAALFVNKLGDAALPDVIVPMPLHATRLKERGFNQAVEIGRLLARRLRVPFEPAHAKRTRHTTPQAGLAFKERHRNVRGVFAFEPHIAGKNIVLLDDIMTTGASLNALAQAAKKAGAARVECWVMARTLPE